MDNVADIYPLAPTQEGILYHALRDDDPSMYFEQVRCDLTGKLDLDRFICAWDTVFARHPALRTVFVWSGVKQPVQVVRETVELPWDVIDWQDRGLESPSGGDLTADLDTLAEEKRSRGFDLQRSPVSRFTLVRLPEGRSHFIWDFHHILLDGWSATMVFHQVLRQYELHQPPAAEPARPFRAYLEWLDGQDRAAAESYWTELLRDHRGSPRMGVAHHHPGRPFELGRHERSLPAEALQKLQSFARSHRLTLNTMVQGAWALALERLADTDDVTFGVVTSGRPADLPGVEEIVGMFLAALPMRVRAGAGEPVTTWLSSIQRQQLDTVHHQHASLADIRNWAGVAPGQELFDSVLVFENYPMGDHDEGELTVVNKQVFEQTHYELTIMIRPEVDLHIASLYDRSRFSDTDVSRIIDVFVDLLMTLADHPDDAPAELDGVSVSDRTRLAQWNNTAATFDDDRSLLDLVQRVAQHHPDQPALVDHSSGRTLSRRRLDERSDALARYLLQRGVSPGDAVGVSIPRSIELVVALLAVWKVGGAYAPLDPEYPEDRLTRMTDGAGISVVIDAGTVRAHGATTVCGEADATTTPQLGLPSSGPDDTACIIFTSGTTGQPKPVELLHRGLVNRIQWQLTQYPLDGDEVCLAKTTLNFVDHLWELWGALIGGATLVLVDDDVVRDPRALVGALARHRTRRLTLVPSFLDAILDTPADLEHDLPELRWVTTSGEPLPPSLVDRFRRRLPQATLLNFYGMSEGSADVTWFDDRWSDGSNTVPIGRPIDNMTVSVRDRLGRTTPIGVTGELYVGGVGLSAGYRGLPELTAERFVPDPDDSSRILYRTGDLGRWTDDGLLTYVSRADRQIKIRGARVEPDEVEQALTGHPLVAAAVASTTGTDLDRRLVAHVLTDHPVEGSELIEFARVRLPAHSVPSVIVPVNDFPLLPTGKIDRDAVTRIAPQIAPGSIERDPTEAESTMLALWTEVLRPDSPVGLGDDFFEIGGDSLLALRLFSRIDREFGRHLPLAQVFESPTPAAMVERLGLGSESGDTQPLFLLSSSPAADDSDRVFDPLARRMTGSATVVELGDHRPDSLITIIEEARPEGPLLVGGHGAAGGRAVELCRRLIENGRRVDLLALIDADVTSTDLPGGAGPARLLFFEPSEADARVPLLEAPETKQRLDDRAAWTGWAETTETMLVPGSSDTALLEPNVGWLAHLLGERLETGSTWSHLVPISGSPTASRRLFTVHGEYGNVVGYRDLAVALGNDWAVIGVQASGVHGTRPLIETIEDMAEAYLAELREMQPEGPYVLGGYSAGGTIVYEMARRLRRAGEEVEAVLWFDHFRMGSTIHEPVWRKAWRVGTSRLRTALSDREAFRAGLERRRLQRLAGSVDRGRDEEQAWWWEITSLTDDRAEAENLRSMLIRDSIRAARSAYVHRGYEGTIVLYESREHDPDQTPDRGWNDDELDLVRVPVPGDHSTVLLSGNVEAIAADMHQRFGTEPRGVAAGADQSSRSPSS